MTRSMRYAGGVGRHLAVLCVVLGWSASAEAQKTDIITLDNGNEITCEIKELERGRLRCKTDAMGTVYIKWQHIVDIQTDKTLEVELESGQRYFGSLDKGESDAEMQVRIGRASTNVAIDEVAFVQQIDPTFWGKLDGNIDFGAQYTQSDNQFDYTLNASTIYTGRVNRFDVEVSSSIRVRDDETTNNRQNLTGRWLRQLQWDRWFSVAITNFEHNDELDLDFRGSLGGGVGRYVSQTNRWTWSGYGVFLYSREQFAGEETGNNNFEPGLGTNLQVFTFGDHDTDVNSTFVFLPSVSDPGRYRIEWTAKLKREVLKDLYISLDFYETYDSRPPRADATKNDLGLTFSIGWKY